MSTDNPMPRHGFCCIAGPQLAYVSPRTREEFDLIALPARTFDWEPSAVASLLHSDGQRWERRVHSKLLETPTVTVVFQWFEERPITAAATQQAAA